MEKIRILIVEDSPTVQTLLVHILQDDPDIEVIGQAVNGREGVAMTAQLKPDIILMDVVMPEMDGLEATRQIMTHDPRPIIIVTAHADSAEMNVAFEALKAGALEIVPKPVDIESKVKIGWGQELLVTIKAIIRSHPSLHSLESADRRDKTK